jgi:AraC-like DNA-binding protein
MIDDFEFVWMLRGAAAFTTADGETPLAPGQLLLVPPGLRHGFEWDRRRPSRHGYVHFRAADVAHPPAPQVRLHRMTADDPLAGLCAYLLWLGRGERDGWHRPVLRMLDLMVALVGSGPLPDDEPAAPMPPALRAAVAQLRQRWAGTPLPRVGVAELAAAALVSRGHLNRLFRAVFGLGAADALERVRCSRAETLLTRTDLTAEAVARQCGFADLSHFSHRFTAIHGVPPSGYRAVYRAAGHATPSVLEHPGVRRLSRLLWD